MIDWVWKQETGSRSFITCTTGKIIIAKPKSFKEIGSRRKEECSECVFILSVSL